MAQDDDDDDAGYGDAGGLFVVIYAILKFERATNLFLFIPSHGTQETTAPKVRTIHIRTPRKKGTRCLTKSPTLRRRGPARRLCPRPRPAPPASSE